MSLDKHKPEEIKLLFEVRETVSESKVSGELSISRPAQSDDGVGAFASLYTASEESGDSLEDVVFKVFNAQAMARNARNEYSILVTLGGMYGHAPKALAYGFSQGDSTTQGDQLPTIAEELVRGVSVRELARRQGEDHPGRQTDASVVIDCFRALTFTTMLLSGMNHSHGDLSFNNAFISSDDAGRRVASFIDFGSSETKTEQGQARPGTPFFMPPENRNGKGGPGHNALETADVYAIGALALYLWLRPCVWAGDDSAFFDRYPAPSSLLADAHSLIQHDDLGVADEQADWEPALLAVIERCVCDDRDARLASSSLKEVLDCMGSDSGYDPEDALDLLRRRTPASPRSREWVSMRVLDEYRILPMEDLVGRAEDIRRIDEAIANEDGIAFVHGFGGIGKTTLAKAYAKVKLEDRKIGEGAITRAYLIPFDNSSERTLANIGLRIAEGIGKKGVPDRQACSYALSAIQGYFDENTLLVIDNANAESTAFESLYDGKFERLVGTGDDWTPYKVIITSRNAPCDSLGECNVPVGPLSHTELKDLFEAASDTKVEDDAKFNQFLDSTEGNTLVTKLSGLLLREGKGTLTQDDLFGGEGLAAVRRESGEALADGRMSGSAERAYSQLEGLLRLSALDEAQTTLLAAMCLLPNDGFSIGVFSRAMATCAEDVNPAYNTLHDKGWIELDAGEGKLGLHPLVRESSLRSAQDERVADAAERLLDALWEIALEALDEGDMQTLSDIERAYESASEHFCGGRYASGIAYGGSVPAKCPWLWSLRQAKLLRALGRTSLERECLEVMCSRRDDLTVYRVVDLLRDAERDEEHSAEIWAHVMHDCSRAQSEMGDYERAIATANEALSSLGWDLSYKDEYLERELDAIRKQELDHLRAMEVARLLARRAYSEFDLNAKGGRDKALRDKESAWAILEAFDFVPWDQACVLYTLAYSEEMYSGDVTTKSDYHKKALKHIQKAISALRDCSNNLPKNETLRDVRLLLATSLNFMGIFYCGPNGPRPEDEEHLAESLELKEEALDIRYELLNPTHMDIARSHNNISFSLRFLGKTEEAFHHALISAKIRQLRFANDSGKTREFLDHNILSLQSKLGLSKDGVAQRLQSIAIPST